MPVDLVTERPPDEDLPTITARYAVALKECMEEVHHQVRNQLNLAGGAMKRHYDRGTRPDSLKIGDHVWLYSLSPQLLGKGHLT